MLNFISKMKNHKLTPYLLIVSFAAILAIALELSFKKEQESKDLQKSETADTYIPAGFVLVPIEIANHEALQSLIGSFAVVDLFRIVEGKNSRPQKVAQQIKLLRAPLNPRQFAVLAPEAISERFAAQTEPLFAVVKNPLQRSAVKRVEEKRRRQGRQFSADSFKEDS